MIDDDKIYNFYVKFKYDDGLVRDSGIWFGFRLVVEW